MLTVDTMQRCFPAKFKSRLTEEAVANINAAMTDPDTRDAMRTNILGFSSVLNASHYSLDEYVNAVKYVSYQMMGDSNVKAWAKVFPDRYARLLEQGVPSKDINAHVRHFNLTKLVNEVRDQSLVPTHILNADVFQEAINVQASLMKNAKSEMVQMQAANSLLTHLKRPEAQKIELDVGIKDDSMVQQLKKITMELAAEQLRTIERGVNTAKEVAHQSLIIEHKVDDDE